MEVSGWKCLGESYLDGGCMGRGCMGFWVVGCLSGIVWVEGMGCCTGSCEEFKMPSS